MVSTLASFFVLICKREGKVRIDVRMERASLKVFKGEGAGGGGGGWREENRGVACRPAY
jgi:hypothetical protein